MPEEKHVSENRIVSSPGVYSIFGTKENTKPPEINALPLDAVTGNFRILAINEHPSKYPMSSIISPTSGNPSYNPNYISTNGDVFRVNTGNYFAGNLMTEGTESGNLMGCDISRRNLNRILDYKISYFDIYDRDPNYVNPLSCLITPLWLLALSPDVFTMNIVDAVIQTVGTSASAGTNNNLELYCCWRYHIEGDFLIVEVGAFTDALAPSIDGAVSLITREDAPIPEAREVTRLDVLGGETVSAYYVSFPKLTESSFGNFDVVIRLRVSLETGNVVGKEVYTDSPVIAMSGDDNILCVWDTWKTLRSRPMWFNASGDTLISMNRYDVSFSDSGGATTTFALEDMKHAYYAYLPGIIGNIPWLLLTFNQTDDGLSYNLSSSQPVEAAPDFYRNNGMSGFLGFDIILVGGNGYFQYLPYAANTWLIWMETHTPFFCAYFKAIPFENFITSVITFKSLSEIIEISARMGCGEDEDMNAAITFSWSVDNETYSAKQGYMTFFDAENKAAMTKAVKDANVNSIYVRVYLNTPSATLGSLTITYK